ncbi:hypothetical protein KKC00_02420, partial [Patescibacteria group bacterium]|nr:hypothetical protein [Patescibacteria group bacterium]
TVRCDLVDGSDTLVSAKGGTYGFYITPTRTGSWSGLPTNPQTINAGALNLSKSSSTPATGKISTGSDIVLGIFDFDAKGEEMRITGMTVEATLGTTTVAQVTLVKIYDENGTIVAGPKDLGGTYPAGTVSFTDTFIVPVGIHKYTVKAKIADAVADASTIKVGIDKPGTTASFIVKGMTSGDTITATPATDVAANTLTVAAGALKVTTMSSPAGRSVAVGTTDFIWATFSLDAAGSGEDVNVTSITPTVTNAVVTAQEDDIDNATLWADLTSANSTRGDVYETKISDNKQWVVSTTTQAFTLTQTLVIPKDTFVKVALVADLSAGASDTATYYFEIVAAGDINSNGATTGATIVETMDHTNHQTMTVTTGGVLTITKDSSTPIADLVLGDSTVTLAVFRLAASNVENLDVDDITLAVTGGTTVDTYIFYNGTTNLGSVTGGETPKIVFTDGTLTLPANGHVNVTVKASLLTVDGSVVTNGTALTATIQGSAKVNTTGLGSGTQITSGVQSAIANTMTIVKAKPTVALASTSPSGGTLYPSTAHELAIFDVTGAGADDVTFTSGDTNLFTVQISRKQGTSDYTAGNWVLKDEVGTTLSTISVEDYDTEVTFLFATADFSVAPGTTKKLKVLGDTHEYTTQYDSIQLWLSDDADANCSYSVNSGTTIAAGTKIFRGNITAGSFTRP